MGGKNGFTLADYGRLSDRQILALLQIEWNEDGQLITEGERAEKHRLEDSIRLLPTPEALGLSREDLARALRVNPRTGTRYLLMFWSVWKKRQREDLRITDEEIFERWRRKVGKSG